MHRSNGLGIASACLALAVLAVVVPSSAAHPAAQDAFAPTAACAQDRGPLFPPVLVPGATWRFEVLADVAHPENVGKVLAATFSHLGVEDDGLLVRFSMGGDGGEVQDLRAEPFQRDIRTLALANGASGTSLSFAPGLVHFAYPLVVGKQWGDVIRYSGLLGGYPAVGDVSYRLVDLRVERISAAGGEFDAHVLENTMTFASLRTTMVARLWVSSDGLLLRRESYSGGLLVQTIGIKDFEVPLAALLEAVSREVELLEHKEDLLLAGAPPCAGDAGTGAPAEGRYGVLLRRARDETGDAVNGLRNAALASRDGTVCVHCVVDASRHLDRAVHALRGALGDQGSSSSSSCVWTGARTIEHHVSTVLDRVVPARAARGVD